MKSVLINALLLTGEYSGVQYSIEYLIEALSTARPANFSFTVLISSDYKGGLRETPNLILKRVKFNSSNRFKRIFYENFFLPRFFKRNKFNLYHSPGYTLPYFFKAPSIITIHDLIALDFPELCQNETAIYFSTAVPRAIKRATKIVAVSKSVKKDIIRRFPKVCKEKITVVYHGIHPRFRRVFAKDVLLRVKRKYDLPDKYLLFLGNLEPKKNLNKTIEVFCELKQSHLIEHQLVIAGKLGWKYSSIFSSAQNSNWHNDIKFLGYVEEEDQAALYSLAEVLLFPSLYEGFGLPVLEAMACGCPVIVSNRGSLPEISGGIGPIVDPTNTLEIASSVLEVINNRELKDSLTQQGQEWSQLFTWSITAKEILKSYKDVIDKSSVLRS